MPQPSKFVRELAKLQKEIDLHRENKAALFEAAKLEAGWPLRHPLLRTGPLPPLDQVFLRTLARFQELRGDEPMLFSVFDLAEVLQIEIRLDCDRVAARHSARIWREKAVEDSYLERLDPLPELWREIGSRSPLIQVRGTPKLAKRLDKH